jgi:hypothetical protein
MRTAILALMLVGSSGSAQAAIYMGEITGTVSSSFATPFTAADAKADIKLGDTITARFAYALPDAQAGGLLAAALGRNLAAMMTNQVSFELAGHRWSSRGSFLNGLVPPSFGPAGDPFRGLALTMDDAPGAGDLEVTGYRFEIGEFGYGLYQGYGYAGAFDLATLKLSNDGAQPIVATPSSLSPIPEPAAWALMIAGFGLAGMAARQRRRTAISFG